MSKKALIIVDYSNDFIADSGKLTCGGAGQAIEGYLVERIKHYHEANENIFFYDGLTLRKRPNPSRV